MDKTKLKELIPATASKWQLYSSMPGSAAAAKAIAKVLLAKLTKAIKADQASHQIACKIRDEMYKEMTQFQKLGARDTEPECVLVETIEKALGLQDNTLMR